MQVDNDPILRSIEMVRTGQGHPVLSTEQIRTVCDLVNNVNTINQLPTGSGNL